MKTLNVPIARVARKTLPSLRLCLCVLATVPAVCNIQKVKAEVPQATPSQTAETATDQKTRQTPIKPDFGDQKYRNVVNKTPSPLAVALTQAIKLMASSRVLLYQNDTVSATKAAREAIRLIPDLPQAHARFADALAAQGKYDEALTEYRLADGGSVLPYTEVAMGMALTLAKLGQYPEAIVTYRIGLRLPVGPQYLSGNRLRDPLGNSYANERRDQRTEYPGLDISFDPAAFDMPLFEAAVRTAIGKRLTRSASSEMAMVEYNKALKLRPNFAPALLNRGMEYYFAHTNDSYLLAKQDWERAVDLDNSEVGEQAEVQLGRRIALTGGGTAAIPGAGSRVRKP